MTIEFRIAQDADTNEWNSVISQSRFATPFHSWNWLKLAEKYSQMKLFPLIGTKGKTVVGVFPLFFQKKGPLRMVFSPPPRSSIFYMGPVFTGNDTLIQEKWESFYKDFHSAFERFIHRRFNPNYIYIALPPALHDPRPFSWSGYNLEPNFDYTIDLSKGAELLYHSLDRKHRNAIKKAIENGMQFKIGGKKEYEKILDLMEIRYAEQGKILNTPRKYFLDLYDSYEEMIKVFVILVEDEVVTGSIRLSYRDTLYGWFGNSRPKKHISPSPNNFLFWETIKFAADHGYNNYTTMGAAGNKRIHEFYTERFNPALCMRYTVTKSTSLTKIIEGSYINILKPLRGRIGHLEQISA